MSLCQYKDILGKPNEGVHSYRIFNIAVVDLALTVIVAYLISKYWVNYNFWIILASLIIFSLFVHKLFCVNTTLTMATFGTAIQNI